MALISSCVIEFIREKQIHVRGKGVSSLWLPVAGPEMKRGCCSLSNFSCKLLGLGVGWLIMFVWVLFCLLVWGGFGGFVLVFFAWRLRIRVDEQAQRFQLPNSFPYNS